MKKLITLVVAVLALSASTAMAQSGLGLYWNDCSPASGGSGASSMTWACNANTGAGFALFTSVIVPTAMSKFTATSAIVDVTIESGTLPDWWQTNAGQCRPNAITMSFDPVVLAGSCLDIWQGSILLSVFAAQQGTNVQGHAANTVRLNGGAAIPAGSEINVPADGSELFVSKVNISRTKSTGVGSCAGCDLAACLVLNECFLQQPAGMGDYRVVNEAPGRSRWVTWNGSPTNCPDGTPTQNRTWGAVKNLYR